MDLFRDLYFILKISKIYADILTYTNYFLNVCRLCVCVCVQKCADLRNQHLEFEEMNRMKEHLR